MGSNVMTWDEAIKKGYEPKLYPFSFEDVPLGTYEAMLDFKIWAKKIMAIGCYFTQNGTGQKFQVTVYCIRNAGVYKIENCETDFVQCSVEKMYEVCVCAGEKKKILFKRARLL